MKSLAPLHIGIFTDVYKPSINGVTSSIELFREQLLKRGHQLVIFAPQITGVSEEEGVIRLPAIEYLSPKNFPVGLPVFGAATRYLADLKLDIVHTHHPFFISQFGKRLARRLSIPHIHTYHTYLAAYAHYFPMRAFEPLIKRYLENLSRSFCNQTTTTIVPSQAIERLLQSYGVTAPIVVNPTGIDLAKYRRLDHTARRSLFRRYQIPNDQRILLFAGRLAREKNLFFLLNCFAKLAKRYPDIHLVFAGGGPEEEAIRQAITVPGFQGRVTVTGYLEHAEIRAFFGAADVFAFPSLTDTQGIVLCEAMAGGTPVVALNTMGAPDIITDQVDGFLTDATTEAFSKALEKLLISRPLRTQFGKAAAKNVQRFSINVTTDHLLDIFEEAIDRLREPSRIQI